MEGVPHHLMDLVEGDETFSVKDFLKAAIPVIQQIHSFSKVAVVVGGSNMYLQALMWMSPLDSDQYSDDQVTECSIVESSWIDLEQLSSLTAKKIHPSDRRRIENAIKRIKKSSANKSTNSGRSGLRYSNSQFVFLSSKDDNLMKQRLKDRIDVMISQGLREEAERALGMCRVGKGILQGIGYKEFISQGTIESVDQTIYRNTWNYFRKQRKWINNRILPRLREDGVGDVINFFTENLLKDPKAFFDDLHNSLGRRNKIN